VDNFGRARPTQVFSDHQVCQPFLAIRLHSLTICGGAFNAVTGIFPLGHQSITLGANQDCLSPMIGVLLLGGYLSRHFGKVRAAALQHELC
jgi:hypothetical protein